MRVICKNVSVSFVAADRIVRALEGLSFEARSGEFLSILGPSGCGKTTLLRAVANLIQADDGTVERVSTPASHDEQALLVFQDNNLFPWMRVLDNAAFGLEMQGVSRPERERRARTLLARLGLSGRENSYPHQLSAGMRQRVAVVRAFLTDPGLLLMDEPFAALDAQTRLAVQRELLDLWEQNHRTVIFVTHDVEEAILLSDRILVMSPSPGAVVAEFAVGLPRPRSAADALSDEVQILKRMIHRKLGSQRPEVMHAARG
jgi:ABC-type nitrate/sulfonate/bicarbonate transport system ATPase subunit